MRNGYYQLQTPISTCNARWVVIGDVTVSIGKIKCLATVGVDLAVLEERDDYTLSLTDLRVIGLHPTESSTGEFAKQAFQEAINKFNIGNNILEAFIVDEGPDVKKGTTLLKIANEKIKVLHDIAHKMSLLLEKDFKNDPQWVSYTLELSKCRVSTLQTELAGIHPPILRAKARFMNVALYIDWGMKIPKLKALGTIPEERYEKYFSWVEKFIPDLNVRSQKVGITEMIIGVTRQFGISRDIYNHLRIEIDNMPLEEEVAAFVEKAFKSLAEEVVKLDEGQVLPASTESLESLYGVFKHRSGDGRQGITGNILGLPVLVGLGQSIEEIQRGMEATPVKKMLKWVGEHVGNTVGKLRNKLMGKIKKQNLTRPT